MIAVDTNIILRFLTGDDEEQFTRAREIFTSNKKIIIADTVILETEWLLRFAYKFSREDINKALTALLGLPNIHFVNPLQLKQALEMHVAGFDFADALHLSKSQNQARVFLTFDKQFIKSAKNISFCYVSWNFMT